MPALLLLAARDLALHDPPRVLAWRLLHEPRLARAAEWLGPLVPRPTGGLDRDPIALLVSALTAALAAAYLIAALRGAPARGRAALLALAASVLVVLPTAGLVAMGAALDRPFGQDGGVVQLPLALERLLEGRTPYGADYSSSLLGRQSRASEFWERYGGNPIVRHHAYLPGTHLLMAPFYLAGRATVGFDSRAVTLLFWAAAAALAAGLVRGASARVCAAAFVLANPLVYWHQVFGANDVMFAAVLLAAALAADRGRPLLAGALLGLACATKQLAWPYAPFLLAHHAGARSLRELGSAGTWRRLRTPALSAAAVFAVVVAPVAALDPRAFYADIVAYNMGLPGGDQYPFGGTPGFGFANVLIYRGAVASLRDAVPMGASSLLLLPLGVLLLRAQLRAPGVGAALAAGSAALLLALYFSRVVHPNYLVAPAILLPVGVLASRRAADIAAAPLLLLLTATGWVENGVFRLAWESAQPALALRPLRGLGAALAPRAGAHLTDDPLGLGLSALAAGLGIAYLVAALLGASPRVRTALVLLAALFVVALPTLLVVRLGARAGTPRAQYAWAVDVAAAADRLASRGSVDRPAPEGPAAREAWSSSFRLEPPARLAPSPLVPPGAAVLAAPLAAAGLTDPRWLSLVALALAAAALTVRLAPAQRPAALAALGLAPLATVDLVFGAGAPLVLAALVAALLARGGGAGALAGAAAAVDHRALLAGPAVLLREPRARVVAALFATAYLVLVLPAAGRDLAGFAAALRGGDLEPGPGAAALFFYAGAQSSLAALVLMAAAPALAAVAAVLLARGGSAAPLAAAAALLLGALASRAPSAADLAACSVLAALAPFLAGAGARAAREDQNRTSG